MTFYVNCYGNYGRRKKYPKIADYDGFRADKDSCIHRNLHLVEDK